MTDWVAVHLDKRRECNRLLAAVPAIVSRVDLEKGTVNLLYPNQLSDCFYRRRQTQRILFAIQSQPLSKVVPWEGPTGELNKLLQHALLSFAEQRGMALKNSDTLHVEANPTPVVTDGSSSSVVWSAEIARGQIQRGLAKIAEAKPAADKVEKGDDVFEQQNAPDCADAESRPKPPTESTQQGTPPGSLRGFTAALAQLLSTSGSAGLPKEAVREALGGQFPAWDSYLTELDDMNKILVAEDAVFRL